MGKCALTLRIDHDSHIDFSYPQILSKFHLFPQLTTNLQNWIETPYPFEISFHLFLLHSLTATIAFNPFFAPNVLLNTFLKETFIFISPREPYSLPPNYQHAASPLSLLWPTNSYLIKCSFCPSSLQPTRSLVKLSNYFATPTTIFKKDK